MNSKFFLVLFLGAVSIAGAAEEPANLPWRGEGEFRILVEVPPVRDLGRKSDELVAKVELNLDAVFPDQKKDQQIDLHSLQVIRQGIEGESFPVHVQQKSSRDRPFRFYDGGLLHEFPTWKRYASLEGIAGRPLFPTKDKLPFGHRVFNAVGEHRKGALVWPHTQDGADVSVYGIYFDLIPADESVTSPPAGWIGDGGNRIVPESPMTGPPGNNSASVVDWNEDGLPDLLYGVSSGYVILSENTGTLTESRFERRKIVCDAVGNPIDAGYDASPLSVDWNGDGVRDLLIGAEKGCILYFKNEGSNAVPKFTFQDFVRVGGEMLLTPNWPIAELPDGKPGEVFSADYLAIPCVCDWDEDGDQDLLAGGFVTGRIFFFENTGADENGIPKLVARGELLADSEILDTGWAAAPVAVDIDHDGDLDLVCGAKPVTPEGGDVSKAGANLLFYRNVGTSREPKLVSEDFPANQLPPTGTNLMAPVCDWNGDSLSDLLLVTRSSMQVFPVPNIGSKEVPLFDMKAKAVPTSWSHQQIAPGDFVDWNHDGHPDIINRFQVVLSDGIGFPHIFSKRVNLVAGKKPIRHPNPYGDENSHVTLYDFDGDGDHDCLYGAHSGHIWFHENVGSNEEPSLDPEGYRLPLTAGGEIQVGEAPADKEPGFNFTDLQGARPKIAPEDFNGDGLVDLVLGDTYGRVRLYRNEGENEKGQPTFAAGFMVHRSKARLTVYAGDWDGDGSADVIVVTGQKIEFFRNRGQGDRLEFEDSVELEIPATIGGYYGLSPVDLNADGDTDLVYQTSSRITCWVERSFLTHGYREAKILESSRRE